MPILLLSMVRQTPTECVRQLAVRFGSMVKLQVILLVPLIQFPDYFPIQVYHAWTNTLESE